MAGRLAVRIALVALALGVADYLLSRRRHLHRLRMSRDEVRRESKEAEGDPAHRAERARLHRELSEQRMVADVRRADFIVVNPAHIAVALRYDKDGEGAPVVVARGNGWWPRRSRRAAREAGVPILPQRELGAVAAGAGRGRTEIPVALYEAVAELAAGRLCAGATGAGGPGGGALGFGGCLAPAASASAAGACTAPWRRLEAGLEWAPKMTDNRGRKVRKAVLPVAGLGTRFLPVTKAVPKELLPLVDVPSIQS